MSKHTFDFESTSNAGWDTHKYDSSTKIPRNLQPTEMPRVAVPSPYARFELMEKAFKNAHNKDAKFKERDLKLVSQALDILQLVFEGEADNLSLTHWNLEKGTQRLINFGQNYADKNPGMLLLGETLKAYATRESFGLNNKKLTGGDPEFTILSKGGMPLAMTCPTSIFLPTPDYKNPLWKNYKLEGKYELFSKDRGLEERDDKFIVFVYALLRNWENQLGGPINSLKEFQDYTNSFKENARMHELREKGRQLGNVNMDEDYERTFIDNQHLDFFTLPMYSEKAQAADDYIANNSDLILKLDNIKADVLPLILSNNIEKNKRFVFTSANTIWDPEVAGIDYADTGIRTIKIDKRTLPNGKSYAGGYLYEHDLLSDQLWKLPYKFNDKKFVEIKPKFETEGYSFLAPVTDTFFEYFDLDFLKENMEMIVNKVAGAKNNKNEIGSVIVTLSIPVKGGKVTLKKTYIASSSIENALEPFSEDESVSDFAVGKIMEVPMSLTLFPLVWFSEPSLNHYAIQLGRAVDFSSNKVYEIGVELYKESDISSNYGIIKYDKIENTKEALRRVENNQDILKVFYTKGSKISYIKLTVGNSSSILIPNWEVEPYKGSGSIHFSFDFGTSNTFVAVTDEKGKENKSMNFTLPTLTSKYVANTIHEKDPSMDNELYEQLMNYINQELLPNDPKKAEKPFPMRTVLAKPKKEFGHADEKESRIPLLRSFIPFVLGYDDYGFFFNDLIRNLKWKGEKNDSEEAKYVPAYINELMWMAQIYAVSKGKSLEQCTIIWTYPISMKHTKIGYWLELWEDAFREYFDPHSEYPYDDKKVRNLPESVAPLLKYIRGDNKKIDDTGISIDIGGGTCDVVIYKRDTEENWKISSFKFGAEKIFGLERKTTEDVPMVANAVTRICAEIDKFADTQKKDQLKEDIKEFADKLRNQNSDLSDMTSSLFALEGQPLLAEKASSFSFNKWLQNNRQYHHIIYFYYGAIIYYICHLIDHLNKGIDEDDDKYEMLQTISFSGSGSKILNVISNGRIRELIDITEKMISHFSGDKIETVNFKVSMSSEPKEITAKGAMVASDSDINKFERTSRNKKDIPAPYYMMKGVDEKGEFLKREDVLEDSKLDILVDSVIDYLNQYDSLMPYFVDEDDEEDLLKWDSFLDKFKNKKTGEWHREMLKKKARRIITDEYQKEGEKLSEPPFFAILSDLLEEELTKN